MVLALGILSLVDMGDFMPVGSDCNRYTSGKRMNNILLHEVLGNNIDSLSNRELVDLYPELSSMVLDDICEYGNYCGNADVLHSLLKWCDEAAKRLKEC